MVFYLNQLKIARVRRGLNYRQLSEYKRNHIIGLHEAGIGFRINARWKQRNIATLFIIGEAGQRKIGTIGDVALDDF